MDALSRQALRKDDVAALKSRLQWIKKHSKDITSSAAPSTAASSSSPTSGDLGASVPKPPPPQACDAQALKWTVTQAKDLAAKAQKRTKERDAEDSRPSETPAPDR